MAPFSYSDVFEVAKQWPAVEQVGLAEALLHNVRSIWRQGADTTLADDSLRPLSGMTTSELQVLADAVVSAAQQEKLHELLDKNSAGMLSPEEANILDALVEAVDQVAMLKARAMYTLQLYSR